jgi:hypothetical protein
MEGADFELAQLMGQRSSDYWIESELTSRDGALRARLLLIPESKP